MNLISTLSILLGYAAVVGIALLGRLDYRKAREPDADWDAR